MRSSRDFEQTVRRGVRVGRPSLVVHATADAQVADERVQVGFVVSKKVGNAVQRNRVKRRLRHFARPLVAETPAGVRVVVRALPAAASEPQRLDADLASAWQAGLRKLAVGTP